MSQTHLYAIRTEACEGDFKKQIANVAAAGTDTSVITAVAGKKLRVIGLWMQSGGTATDITFQSNATAITPVIAQGVRQATILPFEEAGYFETVAGEALKVTTGAGSTTGMEVYYVEVI